MINSLDDAIKHCEEVADGFDETAQEIAIQDENGVYEYRVSYYQDRALSQRQLAEWLKELQELRREHTCKECRYSSYGFSDHPCSVCRRGYYPRHSMTDYYEMGVNADDT